MRPRSLSDALILLLLLLLAAACAPAHQAARPTDPDSAFAAVQRNGAQVMGVNQDASEHIFEDLADGGRILYRMRDTTDAAGVATIREHLRHIEHAFAQGDFSNPAQVHSMAVPGTAVMAERRARIRYRMLPRPGGGELRITTADPEALAAVHEFLAFQRSDHRAAGHEGMRHEPGMDHSKMHPAPGTP